MDLNKHWSRETSLPSPQHWITLALRGLSLAAVAGGLLGAIGAESWMLLAQGLGAAIGIFASALVTDCVIFFTRAQRRILTDHLDDRRQRLSSTGTDG